MRKINNILISIFSVIVFILSFVFVIIEGRLVFSLDWTIYDNAFLGFLKYFFRLIIALLTCVYAVFEFINFKKKSELISFVLFIYNICLVIVSIVLIFTVTNMVGEIAILLSLIILLIKGLFIFLINLKNKTNKA